MKKRILKKRYKADIVWGGQYVKPAYWAWLLEIPAQFFG